MKKIAYYESEIPKELKVNETYTSRQIRIFINENPEIIILADTSYIGDNSDINYRIISKTEKFVHQTDQIERSFIVPNRKVRVYNLEKI